MVGMKGLAAMAALAMIEQPTRYVAPAGCEPPSQTEDEQRRALDRAEQKRQRRAQKRRAKLRG